MPKESRKTHPYCGSNLKAPPGTHLASAEECIKANQIRRFGRYKIDSRLLATSNNEKKNSAFFALCYRRQSF